MTVTLVKPYALNLDLTRDIVVVLRRYDESTHPWGVHVVTVDLTAAPFLQHRTIGLFTDEQVLALARTNKVDLHDPFCISELDMEAGSFHPLHHAIEELFHGYIWTQVVPMEWHGASGRLAGAVSFLAVPDQDVYLYMDQEPYEQLRDWMKTVAWVPQRPALRIVELPA